MRNTWQPDLLGEGFEQLTMPLGADDEGPVVATLVRHLPQRGFLGFPRRPLRDVDVLYVHGWSDYFFQTRLARYWADLGARFYALDLRKYGRSLRVGQTPGYITDLRQYDDDIDAALRVMADGIPGDSPRRLVLLGHSTGGLTLSLWAARNPGRASALILNSPWLEFQLTAITRAAIAPLLGIHSRLRPRDEWPQIDAGYYARAQREVADPDDPMETNPQWRPERTMTVYAGWMHAIIEGHRQVAEGLGIDVPICVLLSARTVFPTAWSEALTAADTVLEVNEIAKASLKLGPSVTVQRIDGALHDVFVSRKPARDEAYSRLDRWVRGFLMER